MERLREFLNGREISGNSVWCVDERNEEDASCRFRRIEKDSC
jgi:hypothetical protein